MRWNPFARRKKVRGLTKERLQVMRVETERRIERLEKLLSPGICNSAYREIVWTQLQAETSLRESIIRLEKLI